MNGCSKHLRNDIFTFHPNEASHESMFMWLRPPRHPCINYARFNCILFFSYFSSRLFFYILLFVLWSRLFLKKRTGFLCLSVVFFAIQFIAIFFASFQKKYLKNNDDDREEQNDNKRENDIELFLHWDLRRCVETGSNCSKNNLLVPIKLKVAKKNKIQVC